MSPTAVVLWLANIVLDTAGHIAFKHAAVVEHDSEWRRWMAMLEAPPIWVGIACFVLEFLAWVALLSLVPLSLAMMIGAIDIVAVMYAGALLFGERLDRMRVAGMWLITAGVALAGWGA